MTHILEPTTGEQRVSHRLSKSVLMNSNIGLILQIAQITENQCASNTASTSVQTQSINRIPACCMCQPIQVLIIGEIAQLPALMLQPLRGTSNLPRECPSKRDTTHGMPKLAALIQDLQLLQLRKSMMASESETMRLLFSLAEVSLGF